MFVVALDNMEYLSDHVHLDNTDYLIDEYVCASYLDITDTWYINVCFVLG